jgi:PAS domain S-box-containing protein
MSDETIHVLHVDDDPEFTDLTASFLERDTDRFTIETATGASEGWEVINDRPPDCIVSDYNMPGTDGIEFLEAVREEYPDLPFVLFTGKGNEEVASDAISAGATDYVQKGSGAEQYRLLTNRIVNVVEQYRSEVRLRETREEYTAVFENARNGLLLVSVEENGFRYQRCNPRAVELIGRDRTDIVGAAPSEALGPENAEKVLPAYRECVEEGDSVKYTVTLDLPVGRVVRECQASPISSDGDVGQLVVAFHDITERRERQRELEAERRFVEQALNSLEDLFYVLDTEGSFRRWNDRVPEVTGYSEPELSDMQATDLFPEDERETILRGIDAALAGERIAVDADLLTADGERIPYELTGARLTDGDGNTTGLVGVARNLTERQRREQRFESLVEQSNDIISVVDADGVFGYQSPSVERILGHDPEGVIGTKAWDYIHPDDRGRVRETFEQWIGIQKAPEPVEYRARHADGSWRWMEARGNNQLDNPAVEGYIVNSRDITDKKERKQELQDLKRQYETLVENFPDGAVFLIDADLNYIRVGGEELSRVGLSPDDIEGKGPHDLFPDEIADELEEYYERALNGAVNTFEQGYGGEQYRVQTVPVRDDTGEVTRVMAVSRNITEYAEDRRDLERQNERLAEFASIVSHDLRNPLNVAAGHIDLAQNGCESDHLAKASDAIDRSNALIDDLLTLARTGERIDELEPVELADMAKSSWQTVDTAQATVRTDTSRVIRADRTRLQQLFENLYRNAVEHGGQTVTVTVGDTETGFYVADTGPGIPESKRDGIFDAGLPTSEAGTGFGLRIVQQITDAHGWEITVTESEQGGARFEITGVETVD